jgi:hypothetical protein
MERLFMGMHAGYLYSKDRILEAQERFEEASWTNVVEQPSQVRVKCAAT